jgi:hypothetical protein
LKIKTTQHKYKEVTEVDELRRLRAENRRLLKEIKRTRKEFQKLVNNQPEEDTEGLPILKVKERCPSCNSEDLAVVDLGIKKLMVCRNCKYRKAK